MLRFILLHFSACNCSLRQHCESTTSCVFMMVEATPVINDDNLSGTVSPFLPFLASFCNVNLARTLDSRHSAHFWNSHLKNSDSWFTRREMMLSLSVSGWVIVRCVRNIRFFVFVALHELWVMPYSIKCYEKFLVFCWAPVDRCNVAFLKCLEGFLCLGYICGIRVWLYSAQEGETEAKPPEECLTLATRGRTRWSLHASRSLSLTVFSKVLSHCLVY